jgi:hypothetical protein
MLVLELMGHLLSYYRRYATTARPATAGPPAGRGGN